MPKRTKKTKCTKSTKTSARGKHLVVATPSGKKFFVSSATSPRGEKWMNVRQGQDSAWCPYSSFRGSGSDAMNQLADQGVVAIGSDWKSIRDQAAQLKNFPPKPLIQQPGWSGDHFAMPDGTVFSPKGASKAIVLFQREPLKCASSGTPKGWRDGVAKPLIGQHLASFMLMTALAPPLLSLTSRVGNFGYELVGDGGKGKSTLQQIMSSVAGGALPSAPGVYWINCNATANGLERAMPVHSDHPMILEEAALYAASGNGRSRGSAFNELVFRLSDGKTKSRFNQHQQTSHRFIYVMSSNQSLAEVLHGRHSGETDAAADRLMTFRIGDDRPYGIFDFLPGDYTDGADFAESLKTAIGQHYGLALPYFARRLVQDRADNENRLRRRIKRHLAKFQREVGANANDGSEGRVIEAFGLSYAAGMIAKGYNILPSGFKCLAAAKACYNLYRTTVRPLLPLPQRLVEIAKRRDVVDLDGGLMKMSDAKLRRAKPFLRTTRSGRREILFTQLQRDWFFPDFREIRRDPTFGNWFKSDRKRSTVRRFVRQGEKKDPVYRFFLPDDDD